MKSKLILLAVTSLLFVSCKNNTINTHTYSEENLQIEVCGETSPEWLINEINGIVDRVEHYRPVQVFSTNYEDTEYIIVVDMVNSAVSGSFRVFLCSGNSVQYGTDTYDTLYHMYFENRENFIFLWSNSNVNQ